MSFYPLISAPGCVGQTTLYNFPPNNWEDRCREARLVNLTWIQEGRWRSIILDKLAYGSMRTYSRADISHYISDEALPLLSLSSEPLPEHNDYLPVSRHATSMPNWRATLGLVTQYASTCYQGELDPFPAPGSMLTFAPFMQFGADIENYMLLLNLEKNPQMRTCNVEIFDSAYPSRICCSFPVRNNAISFVRLDGLGIGPETLPVIICKGMSGIPLYFSKTADNAYLSLEHTHPPASYVIHGRRWDVQKMLKTNWLSTLG